MENKYQYYLKSDKLIINKYVKNIFLEEQLGDTVCAFFAHTASNGRVYNDKFYDLGIINLFGYRLKPNINIKLVFYINETKMLQNKFRYDTIQLRCNYEKFK